eukprot:bmy_00488T0
MKCNAYRLMLSGAFQILTNLAQIGVSFSAMLFHLSPFDKVCDVPKKKDTLPSESFNLFEKKILRRITIVVHQLTSPLHFHGYFLYDTIRNKTYFSPTFPLVEVVGVDGPFVLPLEYLMGLFGQTQYEGETYKAGEGGADLPVINEGIDLMRFVSGRSVDRERVVVRSRRGRCSVDLDLIIQISMKIVLECNSDFRVYVKSDRLILHLYCKDEITEILKINLDVSLKDKKYNLMFGARNDFPISILCNIFYMDSGNSSYTLLPAAPSCYFIIIRQREHHDPETQRRHSGIAQNGLLMSHHSFLQAYQHRVVRENLGNLDQKPFGKRQRLIHIWTLSNRQKQNNVARELRIFLRMDSTSGYLTIKSNYDLVMYNTKVEDTYLFWSCRPTECTHYCFPSKSSCANMTVSGLSVTIRMFNAEIETTFAVISTGNIFASLKSLQGFLMKRGKQLVPKYYSKIKWNYNYEIDSNLSVIKENINSMKSAISVNITNKLIKCESLNLQSSSNMVSQLSESNMHIFMQNLAGKRQVPVNHIYMTIYILEDYVIWALSMTYLMHKIIFTIFFDMYSESAWRMITKDGIQVGYAEIKWLLQSSQYLGIIYYILVQFNRDVNYSTHFYIFTFRSTNAHLSSMKHHVDKNTSALCRAVLSFNPSSSSKILVSPEDFRNNITVDAMIANCLLYFSFHSLLPLQCSVEVYGSLRNNPTIKIHWNQYKETKLCHLFNLQLLGWTRVVVHYAMPFMPECKNSHQYEIHSIFELFYIHPPYASYMWKNREKRICTEKVVEEKSQNKNHIYVLFSFDMDEVKKHYSVTKSLKYYQIVVPFFINIAHLYICCNVSDEGYNEHFSSSVGFVENMSTSYFSDSVSKQNKNFKSPLRRRFSTRAAFGFLLTVARILNSKYQSVSIKMLHTCKHLNIANQLVKPYVIISQGLNSVSISLVLTIEAEQPPQFLPSNSERKGKTVKASTNDNCNSTWRGVGPGKPDQVADSGWRAAPPRPAPDLRPAARVQAPQKGSLDQLSTPLRGGRRSGIKNNVYLKIKQNVYLSEATSLAIWCFTPDPFLIESCLVQISHLRVLGTGPAHAVLLSSPEVPPHSAVLGEPFDQEMTEMRLQLCHIVNDLVNWDFHSLKVNLQLNHLDIYFSFTLSLCLKKEKTKWSIRRLKIKIRLSIEIVIYFSQKRNDTRPPQRAQNFVWQYEQLWPHPSANFVLWQIPQNNILYGTSHHKSVNKKNELVVQETLTEIIVINMELIFKILEKQNSTHIDNDKEKLPYQLIKMEKNSRQLLRDGKVKNPSEQSLGTLKEHYSYACPDLVKEFNKYDTDGAKWIKQYTGINVI